MKMSSRSSSSDWINRHVENRRLSWRCGGSWIWSQCWSWAATRSPATEEYEKAGDGPADHGPQRGEGPVTNGVLFSLLGHGFKFVEQNLGVELAGDLCAELVDGRGDHLISWLLKQLSQGPGPVEPLGVNLDLLTVIGRDDVVHGPDVTAWIDPDSLAWGNLHSRLPFWTDMVGVDFLEGIHHIRIAVQREDLSLCSVDGELAQVLNVFGGAEVGLGQVHKEDIPSFAKIGLPHLVACLEVPGGDELVRFGVPDSDHVVRAHLGCDGHVVGEVEMDR